MQACCQIVIYVPVYCFGAASSSAAAQMLRMNSSKARLMTLQPLRVGIFVCVCACVSACASAGCVMKPSPVLSHLSNYCATLSPLASGNPSSS